MKDRHARGIARERLRPTVHRHLSNMIQTMPAEIQHALQRGLRPAQDRTQLTERSVEGRRSPGGVVRVGGGQAVEQVDH